MNKLIKYFGMLIVAFVILTAGVVIGTYIENQKIQKMNGNLFNSTKIAVVNLDEGITYQDKQRNFAKEILNKYPEDYVLTGLGDAQLGLDNGTYAAYVILPSDFSTGMVSINTMPKKSMMKYVISDNLSQGAKDKSWQGVMKLKEKLNNDRGYVYINAILNEFHEGQDDAVKVLQNDTKDKDVIMAISDINLVEAIDITEVERLKNEVKNLDINPDIDKNKAIIDEIDTTYKAYLGETASELENVKTTNQSLNAHVGEVIQTFNQIPLLTDNEGNKNYSLTGSTEPYLKNYNDKVLTKDKEQALAALDNDKVKESIKNSNDYDSIKTTLDSFLDLYGIRYRNNIIDYKNAGNEIIKNRFKTKDDSGEQVDYPLDDLTNLNSTVQGINDEVNRNTKTYVQKIQELTDENKKLISTVNILTDTNKTLTSSLADREKNIKDLSSFILEIQSKFKENFDKFAQVNTDSINNVQKYQITKYMSGRYIEGLHHVDYTSIVELPDSEEYKVAVKTQIENHMATIPNMDKYLKQYAIATGKKPEEVDAYTLALYIDEMLAYTDDPLAVPMLPIEDITKYLETVIHGIDITNPIPDEGTKAFVEEQNKTVQKSNKADTETDYTNQIETAINSDLRDIYNGLTNDLSGVDVTDPLSELDPSTDVKEAKQNVYTEIERIKEIVDTTETTKAISRISLLNVNEALEDVHNDLKPLANQQTQTYEESFDILQQHQDDSKLFLDKLEIYNPLSKIKPYVLEGYVNEFTSNNRKMQANIRNQDTEYMEFVNKSYSDADKHIHTLKSDVVKYKKKSDDKLKTGLDNAKQVKGSTSSNNQNLMSGYINKLPYTRNGTVNNHTLNDFITDSVVMEGKIASKIAASANIDITTILISLAGAGCTVLGVLYMVVFLKKRKQN